MDLALITPIAHLDCMNYLPGRFALAHIAKENEVYRNAFREASRKGYPVILDNGVFEEKGLGDKELWKLAWEMQVTTVIAPDLLCGCSKENWDRTLAFLAACPEKLWLEKIGVMHVLQVPRGESHDQGMGRCMWVLVTFLKQQTVTHLGICRDLCYNIFKDLTHTEEQEINRLAFLQLFERYDYPSRLRKEGKKIHCLGMGDNVHLIQHYWMVDSMDTASLFWRGMQGDHLGEAGRFLEYGKRPSDYFFRDFTATGDGSNFWHVESNCKQAQRYADLAKGLRNRILDARL